MSKMRKRWRRLTRAGALFAGLLATPTLLLEAAPPEWNGTVTTNVAEEAAGEATGEAAEVCTGAKHGTTITWYEDEEEAAKLAREQGKLLYVMQVSGNFAREEFT